MKYKLEYKRNHPDNDAKVSFKVAFTDDYPQFYSPGGCAMNYCGPDDTYVCKYKITCIKSE